MPHHQDIYYRDAIVNSIATTTITQLNINGNTLWSAEKDYKDRMSKVTVKSWDIENASNPVLLSDFSTEHHFNRYLEFYSDYIVLYETNILKRGNFLTFYHTLDSHLNVEIVLYQIYNFVIYNDKFIYTGEEGGVKIFDIGTFQEIYNVGLSSVAPMNDKLKVFNGFLFRNHNYEIEIRDLSNMWIVKLLKHANPVLNFIIDIHDGTLYTTTTDNINKWVMFDDNEVRSYQQIDNVNTPYSVTSITLD